MMIGRLVPLLVLALQLQPVVLPALCGDTRASRAAGCNQPMAPTHDGRALIGQPPDSPCVNPALCGIAPTATPSALVSTVPVIESHAVAALSLADLHAIDPPAPLPPPPQA